MPRHSSVRNGTWSDSSWRTWNAKVRMESDTSDKRLLGTPCHGRSDHEYIRSEFEPRRLAIATVRQPDHNDHATRQAAREKSRDRRPQTEFFRPVLPSLVPGASRPSGPEPVRQDSEDSIGEREPWPGRLASKLQAAGEELNLQEAEHAERGTLQKARETAAANGFTMSCCWSILLVQEKTVFG